MKQQILVADVLRQASIADLQAEIKRRAEPTATEILQRIYGLPDRLWSVSTLTGHVGEGRLLAIEKGHIADLAIKYGNRAYRHLRFSIPPQEPDDTKLAPSAVVQIRLD